MKVEIFFSHKEFSNGKKIADPKGSRKIFFSRKKNCFDEFVTISES